jgi:hypothetical protein
MMFLCIDVKTSFIGTGWLAEHLERKPVLSDGSKPSIVIAESLDFYDHN